MNSPAASHQMAALVASVEEEEVDCIVVAAAAVEEALMVGLYSYPEVACLEALADSSEALDAAFAAVEEASAVAGVAFYSFLLDLAALEAVDLDSYLEVVAPSFAGLEALIQEDRPEIYKRLA